MAGYIGSNQPTNLSNTSADIDGTLTADGLTVDGSGTAQITSTSGTTLELIRSGSAGQISSLIMKDGGNAQNRINSSGGALEFEYGASNLNALKIANNGDISFYEDTGTTAKFFWDASAESLGIGTSSPDTPLEVKHTATSDAIKISGNADGVSPYLSFENQESGTAYVRGRIRGASNGVDGGLIFQTGSSGSMSEVMRIDSSGNVGIGQSSNLEAPLVSRGLHSSSVNNASMGLHIGGLYSGINGKSLIGFGQLVTGRTYVPAYIGYESTNTGGSEYGDLAFYTRNVTTDTQPSERMRIDSSGNVGIGTSSPRSDANISTLEISGPTTSRIILQATDAGGREYGWYSSVDGNLSVYDYTAGSERMRIDSSGNLLVGMTSVMSAGTQGVQLDGSSGIIYTGKSSTNPRTHLSFFNPNGSVGSISTSASSTSFNTSSDYRLKEDWQPMTGASDRVLALNPVNFAWKADGSRVDGFLAHEAQAVVPEAVTGSKDAMRDEEYEVTPAVYEDVVIPAVEEQLDEEGNVIVEAQPERTEQRLVSEAVMGTRSVPDYQGIDQSKLVPLLTAALQEALTEIADLKARVTALETA